MEHVTIKKVGPRTATPHFYKLRISFDKIGVEWFRTRADAIQNAIELHEVEQDGLLASVDKSRKRQLERQVGSLRRWLRQVEEARPLRSRDSTKLIQPK
jgi:hypothetical protein